MYFEFGKYKIDADTEKTSEYYDAAEEISCQCDGCRNYLKAAELFPAEVCEFFRSLGVEIKKGADIYVNCSENNGAALFYGGFYHVCGELLSDTDSWGENGSLYTIADGFSVGFTKDAALVGQGFPAPAIQMEICFHNVPWLLEEENTY